MRKFLPVLAVLFMVVGCSLDRTIDTPAKIVEVPVVEKADTTNAAWIIGANIESLVSSTTNYIGWILKGWPLKKWYIWEISNVSNYLTQINQWYEVYDGNGVLKSSWVSNVVTLSDTNHTFVWRETNLVKP